MGTGRVDVELESVLEIAIMFDEILEDREESFECEKCGGDVTERDGLWQCNNCDFHVCILDEAVCHDFGEPKGQCLFCGEDMSNDKARND